VASSEALSMPHWAMPDASSWAAAMVIKTDEKPEKLCFELELFLV
jgi:hypothetical protein